MNRNKKIIFSALSTLFVALGTVTFQSDIFDLKKANAVPCTHGNVAHYNGTFNGGNIEVEHWACCSCHKAWADEGRTVEIGNTTTSRSLINSTTQYTPVVQCIYTSGSADWDYPFEPQYSSKDGVMFNTKSLKDISALYFNFTAPSTLSNDKAFGFVIENNTDQKLNFRILSRQWNAGVGGFTIGIGERKEVTSKDVNIWNNDNLKGIAFEFTSSISGKTISGSIRASLPRILTDNRSLFINEIKDANWHLFSDYIDLEHGFGFTKDLSELTDLNLHLSGRVKIDESLYTGVEFLVYNSSDTNTMDGTLWNEGGWDDVIRIKTGVFKAHEWTPVYVPIKVWNYDNNNNDLGIYDLGNSLNGSLTFANFKCVNYAYGYADGEVLTIQTDTGWPEASKEYNSQYGRVFNVSNVSSGKVFATNNGKTISKYKGYEFYAYNYSDVDITLKATNDSGHNVEFGLLPVGEWKKCFIPAETWNTLKSNDASRVENMYFIPEGASNNNLLITFFRGVPNDSIDVKTQYLDLNISTDGELDGEKEILLNVLDNPKVTSVRSISYQGRVISTNSKYVPASAFGYDVGEKTLTVEFALNGAITVLDIPVVLCSKLISNKEDLDSWQQISAALAGNASCEYDGYFALANDIEYNDNWTNIASKNTYYSNSFEYNTNKGFRGTFDGNGHLIKGLHVTAQTTNDWNGNSFIYKLAKTGIIKNLGFVNGYLTAAGGYVCSIGEGTISNVYVKYSNKFSYCDGFGTFFYYDRGNDSGTTDKSYQASEPLTVENCYVDATSINFTGGVKESAMSFIGSKMYGRILMNNVFCAASEDLASHACRVSLDAGYFAGTIDEIKSRQLVIEDINAHLNEGIYSRNDIELPREYVSTGTNYFINGSRSDYSLTLNAPYNIQLLTSISLLTNTIYRFSKTKFYVSRNIYGQNSQNTVSINVNSSESQNGDYSIEYSNNIATLTCHDDQVISKLILEFLRQTIGYSRYGYDVESFSVKNTSNITLSSSIAMSSSVGSLIISGNNISSESSTQMGFDTIDDVWMNVVSEYDPQKSGHYHNQFYFLEPELYYYNHPSWYTPDMNSSGGYFSPYQGLFSSNLCFTANGNSSELALMKNEFYSRFKKVILANPNKNMICVGQHDNDGSKAYCSCSACNQYQNVNIPIINFLNDMSSRVKADPDLAGRDIYIYTMAYRNTQYCPDPTQFTMDDHVGVWFAPINADYSHAINDRTYNGDAADAIYWWRYVTPNIATYLYDANFIEYFSPFNSYQAIIDTNKYLNSIGCKYNYFCMTMQNKNQTGFAMFRQYLQARAAANPYLTLQDYENEFFSDDGYYGKAGSILKYYFDELKTVMDNNISSFSSIYNNKIVKSFKSSSGSMDYWYSYVKNNAYNALDSEDPNYEAHYKHIEMELLFLRYAKYINSSSWFSPWYSGDSQNLFISDCERLECEYLQEGMKVSPSQLSSRKSV